MVAVVVGASADGRCCGCWHEGDTFRVAAGGTSDWAAGEFGDVYSEQASSTVHVPAINLDDVLRGISAGSKTLMKMDIEGSEWKVCVQHTLVVAVVVVNERCVSLLLVRCW